MNERHVSGHTPASGADRVGLMLSAACAAHCVAVPLLLVAAPTLGVALASPWVHTVLAAVVVSLAGFAFWRGFRRTRRLRAGTIGMIGVTAVVFVALTGHEACCAKEALTTSTATGVLGGILLAAGHAVNLFDCRRCRACTPPV